MEKQQKKKGLVLRFREEKEEFLWVLKTSRTFLKRYKHNLIDIDGNDFNESYINWLINNRALLVNVFKTENGYHIYIKYHRKQFGLKLIYDMLKLKADTLQILRFITRGTQTLFSVRRNKQNETYITTYFKENSIGGQ